MNKPILQLDDVAVGYGGRALYSHVNAQVFPGELVTLLGANGAGKSTLLRCITGQLHPMSGTVSIAGTPLSGISDKELARLVAVVNTGNTLAGALTAEELVALGRQPHTGFFGRLGKQDRKVVANALEAVGMTGMKDRQVASLSDGERQKVMIARALAQTTPVVVLDEPTAFLDVASRIETLRLLAQLARDEKRAIILSSHDVGSALRASSRLWLISPEDSTDAAQTAENGKEMLHPSELGTSSLVDGTPAQLIADGSLARLFPGRDVMFDASVLDFVPKSR